MAHPKTRITIHHSLHVMQSPPAPPFQSSFIQGNIQQPPGSSVTMAIPPQHDMTNHLGATNPIRAIPLMDKPDANLNELVVRESSNGNSTLSIVADEDLFHVLKSVRKNTQESVKHLATIQKSAIQGFSHTRYNLLIDNQLPFTISSVVLFPTAVLLFFPVTAVFGLFTFTASLIFAGLAVIAKTRPHTLTIHTSGGPIKTHFFEAQSNGFLMTSTMGSIDGILSDYIQKGVLEIPQMATPQEPIIPAIMPSSDIISQGIISTTPPLDVETNPGDKSEEEIVEPSLEVSDGEAHTSPAAVPETPPPPSPPPAALTSQVPPPPPPPPLPISSEPRTDSISTEEKNDLLDALK